MKNKQFRKTMRFIHIFGGIVLGVYVYSPLGSEPIFQAFTQLVVFPLILAATGIALWQQPALLKFFRIDRRQSSETIHQSQM